MIQIDERSVLACFLKAPKHIFLNQNIFFNFVVLGLLDMSIAILPNRYVFRVGECTKLASKGVVAEWSKALALGASPKGRGFEPLQHHNFYCLQSHTAFLDF